MFRLLPAMLFLAMASACLADVVTIEGFENFDDPGNWQVSTNVPGQTQNATVSGNVPEYVVTNVTEGTQAGKFVAEFAATPTPATANPYVSGGPLSYWSVRYNVNAPSGLPLNKIPTATGLLQADVRNDSPYPVEIALVVDSEASSNLKRGPLTVVPANASIVYSWDFATVPPVAFGDGTNAFVGVEQRLKSLLVYTAVLPTGDLSLTVDNVRNVTTEDLTPPSSPRILSFEQGTGLGQAIVKWQAPSDSDVASYRVYVSNDTNFNSTEVNRLTFPVSPAATVGSSQLLTSLSGLPTGQNLYVTVTAVDDATTPNESLKSQVLAARLKSDGSDPLDRLVMDNDRYLPSSPSFVSQGYFHAAVYTAQALSGLNRTFDSITDEAIAAGQADLTTKPLGLVIWSNLQDGTGASGDSLTPLSIATIQQFLQANGNLIISGSGLAEDIAAQPAGSATLASTLKSALVTADVTVSTLLPYGPVTAPPSLSTALNPATNTVAFSTSANDGVAPVNGSVPIIQYNGVPINDSAASIGYKGSLIYLAFAFESAGDAAGPAASAASRQALMSQMISFLTEETAANDWQLFN